MERLTHERLNGIRDGYWSPNKKQELVDRLAAYENTNLDPEQVKHVKETAKKYLLEKAQGKVGGWIPVEECPPEEPKENPEFEGKKIELYLVTVKGTKYPFRAMWNGKFFTDGWSKCNVIAWRPLPEPYRLERERERVSGVKLKTTLKRCPFCGKEVDTGTGIGEME